MKHLITALLVLLLGVGTVEAALTTSDSPFGARPWEDEIQGP